MRHEPLFNFFELARIEAGDSPGLLPVIEKEIIHYDILRVMSENGFLGKLCFQGGTALRMCYGSERFSEDLDFTGGVNFDHSGMTMLKQCIEDCLSAKYGPTVTVKPPKEKTGEGVKVSTWQVKVVTAHGRPDIPSQKIKIEVANVPSYTRRPIQVLQHYKSCSGSAVIIGAQSMDEIMTDKMLALPASVVRIRYRDIWDMNWMSVRGIKPDAEMLQKKILDYGVDGYPALLEARIASLPGIIESKEFVAQMSRFLRHETVENSLTGKDFKDALTENLLKILSTGLGEKQKPKFK